MSVDGDTVRRIARLSRIALAEDETPRMVEELNGILAFVEQLAEVDVEGVEPMTAVTPMRLRLRSDRVTEGDAASTVLGGAPAASDGFFVVPKVIE